MIQRLMKKYKNHLPLEWLLLLDESLEDTKHSTTISRVNVLSNILAASSYGRCQKLNFDPSWNKPMSSKISLRIKAILLQDIKYVKKLSYGTSYSWIGTEVDF